MGYPETSVVKYQIRCRTTQKNEDPKFVRVFCGKITEHCKANYRIFLSNRFIFGQHILCGRNFDRYFEVGVSLFTIHHSRRLLLEAEMFLQSWPMPRI